MDPGNKHSSLFLYVTKIHLKPKLVNKEKSDYFMLVTGTTDREDSMILNIYHNPSTGAPDLTNITLCDATD